MKNYKKFKELVLNHKWFISDDDYQNFRNICWNWEVTKDWITTSWWAEACASWQRILKQERDLKQSKKIFDDWYTELNKVWKMYKVTNPKTSKLYIISKFKYDAIKNLI